MGCVKNINMTRLQWIATMIGFIIIALIGGSTGIFSGSLLTWLTCNTGSGSTLWWLSLISLVSIGTFLASGTATFGIGMVIRLINCK